MLFQQANLYHYFCQVKSQKDELYKKDIIMENVSFQQETNIEEVFNKYFSRIYRLALQTCKSPEAAEDLTQEVFIKYWESSRTGQVMYTENFLYTIAKRTAIDQLRKDICRDLVLSATTEAVQVKFETLPDEGDEEIEKKTEIEQKLSFIARIAEQMPKGRLQIFKLRWEEGLSVKEIAERLAISLSTVNIQLRKAMDFLKANAQVNTSDVLLACALWKMTGL